jgi:GNAT superfamily N-acetyltransferase
VAPTPVATAWRWASERSMSIKISLLSEADLDDAQRLMRDLGYEIEIAELAKRFHAVRAYDDHAIFTARIDGEVLGIAHIYQRAALEKPVEAYVQSFVVSAAKQRTGIGHALMQVAEDWAQARGLPSIALHTSQHREGALAFYTREGFEEVSHGRMLRKSF